MQMTLNTQKALETPGFETVQSLVARNLSSRCLLPSQIFWASKTSAVTFIFIH
jgi:hypothetical protein